MLHEFMKAAGIQDEETFYKKYPSDEAFFKKFPKFKAYGGAQMDLKGITQTPDYASSQEMGPIMPVQQPQAVGPIPLKEYDQSFVHQPTTPAQNYGAVGPVADNSGMGSSTGQQMAGNTQTPWYKQDSWTTDDQSITAMNPLKAKSWNPKGGVNTNDIFTGTTALIAGALPYTKPKQNQSVLPQAINPNANGIAGSRATYKKGGKIKKAANGTELNRDNWNALQDYTARNAPNYGGDQYNHGQFANGVLQAFNQANPNQAIQPQDIQRYQQDMIGNPQAIAGAQGFSGADNKFGAKTMQQSYKNYQVVHQDAKGRTLSDDYFGTNSNAAAQKLASFNQPRQWQSNNQGIPMNASQSQIDQIQPAMASVHGVGHQVPQKANYYDGMADDYSGDIRANLTMANGGMVSAGNGMAIEDGKYTRISPQTIELQGDYHTNGGTDVAANGQVVEAEKGETLHTDPQGNAIVGGNLHIMGTDTKFKDAFKKIGKQEAKNSKLQDKITDLTDVVGNVQTVFTAPIAGTVDVLNDAYLQKKQVTEQTKQILTELQNTQLQYMDMGVDASKFKGKAKWGMSMAKDGKILSKQQQMMKDHPELVQEALTKYGQPTAGRFDDGLPGKRTDYVSNYITQNTLQPDNQHISPIGLAPLHFVNNSDATAVSLNDPKMMPVNIPQESVTMQPMAVPGYTPISTIDGLTNEDPKKTKGIRNKFRVANYAGELMSMLDQPEPVPSQQVNSILESTYKLSLQAKKNAIISAYKPAIDSAKNNPAQQAAITAQMADKLGDVDSDELILNQQNDTGILARNAQEMRSTRDMNVQLGDTAQQRQAQAISNTRDNRYRAMESFTDKEAKRHLANNRLGMEENLYGWAYNPDAVKQWQMLHPGEPIPAAAFIVPNPEEEYNKKETTRKNTRDAKGKITESTTTVKQNDYFGGMLASRKPAATKPTKKKLKYT